MLRIGIVGMGGMGKVHFNNYKHIDSGEVVAVCDMYYKNIKENPGFGLPYYYDIEEMIAQEDIDVIDICTPTFTHVENARKALQQKKHVICEKPLALHYQEAKELIELAEKQHKQLFVGQVIQYAPSSIILRDLIKSKKYGEVLDASFIRLSQCPAWTHGGWLFDKKKSGLIPFDLHIHDLDLIVSLFGTPSSYTFDGCGNADKSYAEHYRFLYEFEHLKVEAESAWYNAAIPFTAEWRVYFEDALVENNEKGVIAYPAKGEPYVFDTTEKVIIDTGTNVPPTGMYYEELSDFLNQINTHNIDGCQRKDEILSVMKILESISEDV